MSTVAERLQYLMETHRRPNGKKWTIRQIITILNQHGYANMNRGILASILRGETDPRLSHLRALTSFFNVPMAYFYEPNHPLAEEEALISQAIRNEHVLHIYVEMLRLPKSDREQVAKMYDVIFRQLEVVRDQERIAQRENGSSR